MDRLRRIFPEMINKNNELNKREKHGNRKRKKLQKFVARFL